VSVGRSIFNRTCRVNVGTLLSKYGGGGHAGAGGCTLPAATAQESIDQIIETLMVNQEIQ
jgi:nanoRNase/pAp phosphatase (c-di-AMP/oligoRNAs hydrolase)